MLPPQYLNSIVEQRQRELRALAGPLVLPGEIQSLRRRLGDSLIRLGHALAIPEPPAPARETSTSGLISP